MFLEKTMKNNPELIDFAIENHINGILKPDTFVVDLDTVLENAKRILEKAQSLNIKLYVMLKQLGRNPLIANELMKLGYEGIVAVDYFEAKVMMDYHIKLSHVGHLVQIPKHQLREVMKYGVEIITVYSKEKIDEINEIAAELGIVQNIMIKPHDSKDIVYPGQESGFIGNEIKSVASYCKTLKNIHLTGVTSFPAFIFNEKTGQLEKTHNYETIIETVNLLKEMGFEIQHINMPSTTSLLTLDLAADSPMTHGEPGHGFTGTTPANNHSDGYEKQAVIYLSEVSHNFKGKGYVYGGGYYRRSHLKQALIINADKKREIVNFTEFNPENIDYYLEFNKELEVSATAIMAFRFQIFVTRSTVAIVKGLSQNKPEIMGFFNGLGREIYE